MPQPPVANTRKSDNRDDRFQHLTSKAQVSALRSAISYLRYNVKESECISIEAICEGAGIDSNAFNSFMFHRTGTHGPAISKWLYKHLQTHRYEIEEWAYPIFLVALPGHPQFAKSALAGLYDVFLRHATMDESNVDEFLGIYGGVYTVFRYAAHLDTPDVPKASLIENAFVVRAAMHIYRDGQVPAFRICYRHSTDGDVPPTEIKGVVVVGSDGMYMLGIEDYTLYPIVVTASRRHAVAAGEVFYGVVLRRHRDDARILASRVAFRRVSGKSEKETFESECQKVGVMREADAGKDFDERIRQRVNNKVDLEGKMTLRL